MMWDWDQPLEITHERAWLNIGWIRFFFRSSSYWGSKMFNKWTVPGKKVPKNPCGWLGGWPWHKAVWNCSTWIVPRWSTWICPISVLGWKKLHADNTLISSKSPRSVAALCEFGTVQFWWIQKSRVHRSKKSVIKHGLSVTRSRVAMFIVKKSGVILLCPTNLCQEATKFGFPKGILWLGFCVMTVAQNIHVRNWMAGILNLMRPNLHMLLPFGSWIWNHTRWTSTSFKWG